MSVGVSALNVLTRPCTPGEGSIATDTGWRAQLALGFQRDGARTVLARRKHSGPLRVQRPFYPEAAEVCHVYLLHPPGGLVGGDALSITIDVDASAHALVTTPAAGKFYRSAGLWSRQQQQLNVASGAKLEWLPQENIVFNGARAAVRTRIVLDAGAQFIGWDMTCLGRPAARESFDHGAWRCAVEVWRGATPLLIERANVAGGSSMLSAPWGWAGDSVSATLLATGDHHAVIDDVRALLADLVCDGKCGVTQIADVLVCRYLGPDADEARRCLQAVWAQLRQRVVGCAPCRPRIWET